jgi:AsmA protein
MQTIPHRYAGQAEPQRSPAPADAVALRYPEQLVDPTETDAVTPRPFIVERVPPRRKPSTWLAWVVIVIFAIIALPLGAFAAIVLATSPGNLLREMLSLRIKEKTGADLEIGRASFVADPSPGVLFSGISLHAPGAPGGPPLLKASRLHMRLAILPLLQGRIVVSKAELIGPDIRLRIDREGRRNWSFADPIGAPASSSSAAVRRNDAKPDDTVSGASRLALAGLLAPTPSVRRADRWPQTIGVRNGTVRFTDERRASQIQLASIDLDLDTGHNSQWSMLAGQASWRGETVKLAARLDPIAKLIAREPGKLSLTLTARTATATFVGAFQAAKDVRVFGDMRLTSADPAGLLAWSGFGTKHAKQLGQIDALATLDTRQGTYKLEAAEIAIGTTRVQGTMELQPGSTRPRVRAQLAIAGLDVDRLRAILSDAGRTSATALDRTPGSVGDRLAQRGLRPENTGVGRFSVHMLAPPPANRQVRGYRKRSDWDDEPLRLEMLTAADIDARMSLSAITAGGLEISRAAIRLELRDGAGRLDIDDAAIQDGQARGFLTLAPHESGIRLALEATLDGIAAAKLLDSGSHEYPINGIAKINAAVSGAGSTQREIASSLSGNASIAIRRGALVGWDIPAIVREFERGRFGRIERIPSETTPFDELSATFAIAKGVAETGDIRLKSTLLEMTGAGTADIGRRTLDLLVKPKLHEGAEGRGGARYLGGVAVPVRIEGDWAKPSIRLEPGQAWRDPKKRRAVVGKLRKRFKGRNAEEVIRGILRDGGSGEDVRTAKEVLKDLLR